MKNILKKHIYTYVVNKKAKGEIKFD